MQHALVIDTDSDQDITFTHNASIDCIIAYHEAGHTVAALALGMSLEGVSLVPPKTTVRHRLSRQTSHDFITIERDALYTMAGEMAEKAIHDDYDHASADDRVHFQALADTLYPDDPGGVAEWTARMKLEAEALIAKHWTDIGVIAMNLLSEPARRFSGDEIRALLGK